MKSRKLFGVISAILCVVLLTATFSAASELPKPYALFTKAAKKAATLTSLDVTATITQTLSIGQQKITMPKQTEKIKVLRTSDKRIQFESVTTDVDTREVLSREWYKDGYVYSTDGEMKFKQRTTFKDIFDPVAGVSWSAAKESDFKEATIEKTKDGYYRIVYKLPLERGLSDPWLALMYSDMAEESGGELRFSDIGIAVTVDADGNLKSSAFAASISISGSDGSMMKVKTNISYKINSVNTVKSITFPKDLSTYRLV